MTKVGRSLRDGLSQAVPKVSALRASIPSALTTEQLVTRVEGIASVIRAFSTCENCGWDQTSIDTLDAAARELRRLRAGWNEAVEIAWTFRNIAASGIAARSDETRSGSAEGESPSDAQNTPSSSEPTQ